MKLQDQVITREQANQLKELGIDGDSLFAWEQSGLPGEWRITYPSEYARETKREFPDKVKWIPAWTVAELGVMLPEWITVQDREYRKEQWFNEADGDGNAAEWVACYKMFVKNLTARIMPNHTATDTEAEARGWLLIYLLEKQYTTPEQVNARIN